MENNLAWSEPRTGLAGGVPKLPLPVWSAMEESWRAATRQSFFRRTWLLPLVAITMLTGCATSPISALPRRPPAAPIDALTTHRGVLTVLGRQYTLNGYLATSTTGAQRLILTENFGAVLADVLVAPEGSVHIMRSSRAFKPAWIRKYIAADLQCLFGGSPPSDCPGQRLSSTHFRIERRWYKLDLQIVETKAGPQPEAMFDPAKAKQP